MPTSHLQLMMQIQLLLLGLLVSGAVGQQQCLIGLITEIQNFVFEELMNKHQVSMKYAAVLMATFMGSLITIIALCIGIVTYDSSLQRDWARELDERETAKNRARIRAVCALHGESACACMGKYIIAKAIDGSATQEQDANELWAQQMKPAEAGEEYRDHVD